MNISSAVIKCAPKYLDGVLTALEESGLCEIYMHDADGRIVVVLEGENTEEETNKLKVIEKIDHILSAEMVYAFSEDEFAAEGDKFEKVSDNLLTQLNSDTPAEEIVYHGHLKDK